MVARSEIAVCLFEYSKNEGKNAKTSLLLDIEAGNQTEIETLHAALVRCARDANLSTPLLDMVYAIVKVYEASRIAI